MRAISTMFNFHRGHGPLLQGVCLGIGYRGHVSIPPDGSPLLQGFLRSCGLMQCNKAAPCARVSPLIYKDMLIY
jgi:hypothetical protein